MNGGFFVVDPEALDYIDGDQTTWEPEPMEGMARGGRVAAFRHRGLWQPMDTLRRRDRVQGILWQSQKGAVEELSDEQAPPG